MVVVIFLTKSKQRFFSKFSSMLLVVKVVNSDVRGGIKFGLGNKLILKSNRNAAHAHKHKRSETKQNESNRVRERVDINRVTMGKGESGTFSP